MPSGDIEPRIDLSGAVGSIAGTGAGGLLLGVGPNDVLIAILIVIRCLEAVDGFPIGERVVAHGDVLKIGGGRAQSQPQPTVPSL